MADSKPQKASGMKGRRHSSFQPRESMAEEGQRSLMKYLKTWRKKSSSSHTCTPQEQKLEYIRVVATALNSKLYYKTLSVTEKTTAYDVIATLVEKYAITTEDQCVDNFYLMETQENAQGSYSRVMDGGEKVGEIQRRWNDSDNCFTLGRRLRLPREDSFLGGPLGATVLSPGQDSDSSYPVFIEEGGSLSPTLSEFMTDSYFSFTSGSDISTITSRPTSTLNEHPRNPAAPTSLTEMKEPLKSPDSLLGSSLYTSSSGSMPCSPYEIHPLESAGLSQMRGEDTAPIHSRQSRSTSSPEHALQQGFHTLPKRSRTREAIDYDDTLQTNGVSMIDDSGISNCKPSFLGTQKANTLPRRKDVKLSRLMQQSIDEGMSGIMNKVVTEQGKGKLGGATTLSSSAAKEAFRLRALVCSPRQTVERKYPEFVFTPGEEKGEELAEFVVTPGAEKGEELAEFVVTPRVGENRKPAEERREEKDASTGHVRGNKDKKAKRASQNKESREGNSSEDENLATKVELTGNDSHLPDNLQQNARDHVTSHDPPSENSDGQLAYPQRKQTTVQDEAEVSPVLYCYYKTSKLMQAVLFETELTIHPTFQSSVGLYPSFLHCDYYNSEMDILYSLSTLLNLNLPEPKARSRTKPAKTTSSELLTDSHTPNSQRTSRENSPIDSLALSPRKSLMSTPATGSSPLISPAHKNKLIMQAARAVMRRRAQSCGAHSESKPRPNSFSETTGLISPSHKDRLIQQAATALRHQRAQTLQSSQKAQTQKESDMEVEAAALHTHLEAKEAYNSSDSRPHEDRFRLSTNVEASIPLMMSQSPPLEANSPREKSPSNSRSVSQTSSSSLEEVNEAAMPRGIVITAGGSTELVPRAHAHACNRKRSLPEPLSVSPSILIQPPLRSSRSAKVIPSTQQEKSPSNSRSVSQTSSLRPSNSGQQPSQILSNSHFHGRMLSPGPFPSEAHARSFNASLPALDAATVTKQHPLARKLSFERPRSSTGLHLASKVYKSMEMLPSSSTEVLCSISVKSRPITVMVFNTHSRSATSLSNTPLAGRKTSEPVLPSHKRTSLSTISLQEHIQLGELSSSSSTEI